VGGTTGTSRIFPTGKKPELLEVFSSDIRSEIVQPTNTTLGGELANPVKTADSAEKTARPPVGTTPTTASSGIRVVDYSARSVAVFGDTKRVKDRLKAMGGRFNGRLKENNETAPGWVFPMSRKSELEEEFCSLQTESVSNLVGAGDGYGAAPPKTPTVVAPAHSTSSSSRTSTHHYTLSVRIVDYSARSVAVFGETKPIKEKLKELGGRFNGKLKENGVPTPGWIFPSDKKTVLESVFSPGVGAERHVGNAKPSPERPNPTAQVKTETEGSSAEPAKAKTAVSVCGPARVVAQAGLSTDIKAEPA